MTSVTIFRSGSRISGFEAQGHTGYADAGEDVVCSAVSALTQTALLGLGEYLKISFAQDISDGYLYCMLSEGLDKESLGKADVVLETMALGLGAIAETYPTFLRMNERQV